MSEKARELAETIEAMWRKGSIEADVDVIDQAVAPLVEALRDETHHIFSMQRLMVKFLTPDSGMTQDEFVNKIIYLLDGPEERKVIDAATDALKGWKP